MLLTKNTQQILLPLIIICTSSAMIAPILFNELLSHFQSAVTATSKTTKGPGYASRGENIFKYACADCHHASDQSGGERIQNRLALKSKFASLQFGQFWKNANELHSALEKATEEHSNAIIDKHEVYHMTAYILHSNGLIHEHQPVDQEWLISSRTLTKDGFVTVWPNR